MTTPFRTAAIILRRTNYGEADRILNLLTPERGQLSAIAKGVRKPKSKLAGGLELFATCDVTTIQGRSDMGTVSSARLVKFYGNILKEYERMQLGYELVAMIHRVSSTITEPELYYLLRDSFAYLDALSIDYRLVEVWFRLRYAAALGIGLNLARTSGGELLRHEARYEFDFSDMAFVEKPQGRFGENHIKFLRLTNAKNPDVLRQVGGLETVLDDCLWLVRTLS